MVFLILNILDRIFGKMFGAVGRSAKAKAERGTVGKAEGKVMGAQQRMQQKALRSMDKVGPDMAKGKGGQEQAGDVAGMQPANPGYQPDPNMMEQPQAGAQQMGQQQSFCPNGHPIDPSWDVCPYCRTAVSSGQQAASYQPPAATSGGPAKTVAIDASALVGSAHVNKAVVGWIVAMSGEQKGQDFRLHDGRNVLGTAADCDVVIFDPYLSARHAVFLIESAKGRYIMQDLDSRNGTYVNRKRIIKEELFDNDEIRFGQSEFRFKSLY